MKTGRKRLLAPEMEMAVVTSYKRGQGGYELAKAFGVSTRTIYNVLERYGITRRPTSALKELGPDEHRCPRCAMRFKD